MDAFVPVEREDDLAVAARLEVVSSGIQFTDLAVVVDFPVDGQYLFTVGREKRLPAALRIDDGKAFVAQDGCLAAINATPVRPAVADFLGHGQSLFS